MCVAIKIVSKRQITKEERQKIIMLESVGCSCQRNGEETQCVSEYSHLHH